jgi:hypothetical protein
VLVALGLVVMLGITGIAVDVGRLMAERRHLQTAADAAALSACQSLTSTAVADISAAAEQARRVAGINMEGSPSGTLGVMADPAVYEDQDGNASLEADELTSGVVVSAGSARVAISAEVSTTFARVVGIPTLGVGARAHCTLVQEPALPIVARRYTAPPGPGGGFVDVLATEATSQSGQIDANPLGYDVRFPASTGTPGPLFEIYGTGSKAHNSSEFRGFINLDIRDYRDLTTREYYNGAEPGVNENIMKAEQAQYVISGYPGPGFPAVSATPTGALQVATLSGHNTGHLVDAFDDIYSPGDRILLAVYDGTVKAIPDFQILPPNGLHMPATGEPTTVHSFTVTRNDQFNGAVELELIGDTHAADPTDNILPIQSNDPPAAGTMNEPLFNPDGFTFSGTANSQIIDLDSHEANDIPPGIYTVWLKGTSSVPIKSQAHPVPVYVGGATQNFDIAQHSSLSASAENSGDAVTYDLQVRPDGWQTSGASQVALGWDPGSLTTCVLAPVSPPAGMTVSFSQPLVTPANGPSGSSTMTVDTDGLASGCYRFAVRAHATNSDGQPVTRLASATLYVDAEPSDGEYVEIIGFAMFQVADVDSNTIRGRAISSICPDPDCSALREVQHARLIPWSSST